MPPVFLPERKYQTHIGGMLPNDLAYLYAEIFVDYNRCLDAYINAQHRADYLNRKQ
jgi:hypothetical protein